MGLLVRQHEWNGLSGGDRKLAHGCQPIAPKLDGRSQDKHVRTGNREKIPIIHLSNPRDRGTIIETDDQLGAHRDGAALADNQTHEMGVPSAQGQEVDQHDFAVHVTNLVSRIRVLGR
jgi:hypothetical protein